MDQILAQYPLKKLADGGTTVQWTGNCLLGNWSKCINADSAGTPHLPGHLLGFGAASGKHVSLGMWDALATAEPTEQWVKVRRSSTSVGTVVAGVAISYAADAGEAVIVARHGSLVPCLVQGTITNNAARAFVIQTTAAGQTDFSNTAPTAPTMSAGRVVVAAGTGATQSGSASYGIILVNPV